MNSAPSSRYRMASEPITPISETALEIGCVCTTTLIAHTTAINAKIRKRITSMSRKPGDQKAGHQQVQHGHREKALPGEPHQLVVAEPRHGAPDPHESEQDKPRLRREPEQGQQPTLNERQKEHSRDDQENDAERREG